MFDKFINDKSLGFLYKLVIATTVLHIFLGFLAGLQNCPIRNFGIFFTILGIMALICVIWSSLMHPIFMPISLIVIIIPGMIAAVVIKLVLTGMILSLLAAPAVGMYEIIKTIAMIYGF